LGPHSVRQQVFLVNETDDYIRSVRTLDLEVIRRARGIGPTEVRFAARDDYTATALRIGFPVFSRTAVPAHAVGIGVIVEAPSGTRWCGMDLHSGDVLVYGPGAEHVATNPQGLRFVFTVVPAKDLYRVAAHLQLDVQVPPGVVRRMASSSATRLVHRTLTALTNDPGALNAASSVSEPGLVCGLANMLAGGHVNQSVPTRRKIDDRQVMLACIDYAEAVERIPTMPELCEASSVSERRLREAFVATHDLPPHRFFLTWALDRARRRLVRADPTIETVTRIAADTGFTHLGRFARYYKQQFGESPSMTLRWTPVTENLR
jgi:AraC-like DNA-binding protein